MRVRVLHLVVLGLLAPPAFAQVADVDSLVGGEPGSPPPRSGLLYVLPVLAYSPETELAFGASTGFYLRLSDDPARRPSTFNPTIIVTTADQLMALIAGDVWWHDDTWHAAGMVGYLKFPTRFYGLGDDTREADEETLTPHYPRADVTVSRALARGLYLGARLEWEHVRITGTGESSFLRSGAVTGADGGTLVGVGAVLTYDTRDALFYPTRGWLHQLGVSRYAPGLGSDFAYTRTTLDLRRFLSLGGTRVVACQVLVSVLGAGTAPFYQLQRIGLRGYYETRYLTTHVALVQAELRTVLRGRLGAVVFAGAAEVGDGWDALRLREVRPAAGFGLRVRVGGEADRSNLRFDFGFGRGDAGFYVNFGEAF